MSMPAKKRKGGNPANRTSGRVTPKGTVPVKPGSGKIDNAQHRARVTGRRKPRVEARVHPNEWKGDAHRMAVLRGVLAELDRI